MCTVTVEIVRLPPFIGRHRIVGRTDRYRNVVRLGVVDMVDNHATLQRRVPTAATPAFINEILTLGGGGCLVGFLPLHRIQRDVSGRHVRNFVHPSQHDSLQCREIGRGIAGVCPVIAAGTHRVIRIHGTCRPIVSVIRVVEIRKAERMGELMAGRADPAHGRAGCSRQFRRAEIPVDPLAVEGIVVHLLLQLRIIVAPVFQVIGMRPDRAGRSAFRLIESGIIHQQHVHITVAVIIILAEIHTAVQLLAGLENRQAGVVVIRSVRSHAAVQGHRPVDVEDRVETVVGLVVIPVADRADPMVVGIAFLVEQVLELGLRLGKTLFAEPHQDDRDMPRTVGHIRIFGVTCPPEIVQFPPEGIGNHHLLVELFPGDQGFMDIAVLPDLHNISTGIGEPVHPLVTMALQFDGRPVRLGIAECPRHSRNGIHQLAKAEKRGKQDNDLLSHGALLFNDETIARSVGEPDLAAGLLDDGHGILPFHGRGDTDLPGEGKREGISLRQGFRNPGERHRNGLFRSRNNGEIHRLIPVMAGQVVRPLGILPGPADKIGTVRFFGKNGILLGGTRRDLAVQGDRRHPLGGRLVAAENPIGRIELQ